MDPVMENDPRLQGLGFDGVKAKGALFLYCRGTTMVGVRSLRSKEAKFMEEGIRSFKGKNEIGYAYTDQCRSLAKGLRNMKVTHGVSEPGVPQTNASMETMIKIILGGARVNLATGGAPVCFYVFACDHYCMCRNIRYGGWEKSHDGCKFPGLVIPFMAMVD